MFRVDVIVIDDICHRRRFDFFLLLLLTLKIYHTFCIVSITDFEQVIVCLVWTLIEHKGPFWFARKHFDKLFAVSKLSRNLTQIPSIILGSKINPSHPKRKRTGRRANIDLNFYFHTSLWCLKKGVVRTFWILKSVIWLTKDFCWCQHKSKKYLKYIFFYIDWWRKKLMIWKLLLITLRHYSCWKGLALLFSSIFFT